VKVHYVGLFYRNGLQTVSSLYATLCSLLNFQSHKNEVVQEVICKEKNNNIKEYATDDV
jgi:hypothetical protein